MENDMLSITEIIIFVLLAILYLVMLIGLRKRIRVRRDENGVHLDLLREKFENKTDELLENYISTSDAFTDMYHLLIYSPEQIQVRNEVPNNSFFDSLGIDFKDVKIKDNSVMCLMPFNKKYAKSYTLIKEICEAAKYECRRSDEEFVPNMQILPQIVKMILESEIIIAVLNGRNPNVFYEIGIAHSVGKPVLLLSDMSRMEFDDIPFDVQSIYSIQYNNPTELKAELTKRLITISHE